MLEYINDARSHECKKKNLVKYEWCQLQHTLKHRTKEASKKIDENTVTHKYPGPRNNAVT